MLRCQTKLTDKNNRNNILKPTIGFSHINEYKDMKSDKHLNFFPKTGCE